MRNILNILFNALAIIGAIALAAGIGIAIIGSAEAQIPLVQEMKPPLSKSKPLFNSDKCSSVPAFNYAMKKNDGKLATSGENLRRDRIILVIVFPDTSFGVFTYNPVSGFVCVVSIGWFTPSGSNA